MQSGNNFKKQKVLIFYAKAGGGHESAARAIQKSMESSYHAEVKIVDVFSSSSAFTQFTFNQAYIIAISSLPWLWRMLCWMWSIKWMFALNFWFAKKTSNATQLIRHEIEHFQPDVVITTYFSLDLWISEVLEKMNKKLPILSVVCDIFSPHPSWFLNPNTDFCVFSKEAADIAATEGVPANNIYQFDPFFDQTFLEPIESSRIPTIQKQYNLNPTLFTAMISGGGTGIPATIPLINNIIELQKPFNLIVICGRNEGLKREVENLFRTKNHRLVTTVTGFTSDMYNLTSVADIVIAKAGPATVFELLAIKKPLLLAHFIWPQEEGNMRFVVDNKYGLYEINPAKITNHINSFLENPAELEVLKKQVQTAHVKNGMNELIQFIEKKILNNF